MKRGTQTNLPNRFEELKSLPATEWDADISEAPDPRTQFLIDHSRTAIASNQSPDVGFDFSINPYRGCEHGCIYCYARPTHEYLGYSSGLDFETKILVKENLPELLRKELSAKKWKPAVINISGVTDCYQPIERKLELTRKCLKILNEFKNPVTIITKNQLVTRDIDILQELQSAHAIGVFISVTTLDIDLCGVMEPRTSRPEARLRAIEKLSQAGIPVGVMVAPLIVGLTEHEMPAILKASAEAGASMAGYVPLRLPYQIKDLFSEWLKKHRPEKEARVLERIRSIREGKLNDSEFGSRMRGQGAYADQISKLFEICCRKFKLNERRLNLSTSSFKVPNAQRSLFD